MMDYAKYDTTTALPEASSLIETLRAIGYSPETAVADIVDNSISAEAKNIWINHYWNGSKTIIIIRDDGIGMNNEELIQAMRPGSKNPLLARPETDLGRFGLGLKTASFSQCKRLSVISKKKNSELAYWTWDLDYVHQTGKWELIKFLPNENLIAELNDHISGTFVIWTEIDRIVKDYTKEDDKALDKFLAKMEEVRDHLAMIFHRFLESKKIDLWFQNREIIPWNPLLAETSRVQNFPSSSYSNGHVNVKGAVLKHKSAFTSKEFDAAGGIRGWNDHQGFYIYRNDRMLVSGSWLGLWAKEEHYKLARIAIDISSEVDSEWQIDIRKAIARIPPRLKELIKSNAADVRKVAVDVYRKRSIPATSNRFQVTIPLWKELSSAGSKKWSFKINRDHPILTETIRMAEANPKKAVNLLLRHLEETVPVKSIYIKEAEDSYNQSAPFEEGKRDDLIFLMKQVYYSYLESGNNDSQAKAKLKNLEPFCYYVDEINALNK